VVAVAARFQSLPTRTPRVHHGTALGPHQLRDPFPRLTLFRHLEEIRHKQGDRSIPRP